MLKGADLSAAYASADIFMMPSETETLGFVALEAMASGLPVVAVAAGGLTDIITHPGVTSQSSSSPLTFPLSPSRPPAPPLAPLPAPLSLLPSPPPCPLLLSPPPPLLLPSPSPSSHLPPPPPITFPLPLPPFPSPLLPIPLLLSLSLSPARSYPLFFCLCFYAPGVGFLPFSFTYSY